MTRRGIFLIAFALLFTVRVFSEDDVSRVLEKIAALNRFSGTYSAMVRIVSHVPEKADSQISMKTYVQGLRRVLLIYQAPRKDAGKKVLLRDGKIWFYFPKAGAAIIMNQLSGLAGTISIGDITMPPLLDYYTFDSASQEKKDGASLHAFSFKAKGVEAPYGRVVYFYDGDKVVSSESYSRSGILLKRAFFEDYVEGENGSLYAARIRVESGVSPGTYSLISLSDLTRRDNFPPRYFTPDGMGSVND